MRKCLVARYRENFAESLLLTPDGDGKVMLLHVLPDVQVTRSEARSEAVPEMVIDRDKCA